MKSLFIIIVYSFCFITNINVQGCNIIQYNTGKNGTNQLCAIQSIKPWKHATKREERLFVPFRERDTIALADGSWNRFKCKETFTLSDKEKKEGFKVLFDGTNMNDWTGDTAIFVIEDGDMVTRPKQGNLYGNLFTKEEYGDFDFRFEFQLTPGANSGVGIRAPLEGNAAYLGMELQIIDNGADVFKNLKPYQYHGSIYGVIPAKRGYLKPVGEWNYEEVIAKGPKIKIILNGTDIVDADITEASENGTMDHLTHPGLKRTSGHIGFLGHASVVRFKNIRVKDLSK